MAQQKYLSGLEFDHIWLDLETNPETNPGIKEPFLLLIEKKTGNVFTLLVYLKSLLDSNYSRKTSQFKNREVNIPQEVAIPEEKQKLIHWKWAEESSSELKDYLKKHVFEEKRVESPTGHLMLVVLPVAYVALVHYEDAQCKPLTLAFHRAIRHSTYWPWLPGMDKKEEMVHRLDELSGFDANNVDQKLFHGPVDFIETAKKFMFAFPSEAEKDKYKRGRIQNCPFERDEENNIHALLESSQVGLNGMGPPPQEGHQAPNPETGTDSKETEFSMINLEREVEKLREEVKQLRRGVQDRLKPALSVLSQGRSNEITGREFENAGMQNNEISSNALFKSLLEEVDKLREEVKQLPNEVQHWLQLAPSVRSRSSPAQSNEISGGEFRNGSIHDEPLCNVPAPDVPPSGNLVYEPVGQRSNNLTEYLENSQNSLNGDAFGLDQNGDVLNANLNLFGRTETALVAIRIGSLDISGERPNAPNGESDDRSETILGGRGDLAQPSVNSFPSLGLSHSQNSSTACQPQLMQGSSSSVLLPADTAAYNPADSLILNDGKQDMGQVSQTVSK